MWVVIIGKGKRKKEKLPRTTRRIFGGVCTPVILRTSLTLLLSVFANGPRDLGSIPGGVIPKTLKYYLMPPCSTLTNIRYVSRVK